MTTVSQPPSDPIQKGPLPRLRRRSTRVMLLVGGLITALIVGGIAWWLASPLFVYNTGNATNPFATATTASTANSATSTPTSSASTTPVATPTVAASGPTILATGTFIDIGDGIHHGSGKVSIGKTAAGKYVLYMEQIDITNGPDIYVYLSRHNNPTIASQVTDGGANLGRLHETKGSVAIPIAEDIGKRLNDYHSVAVYCRAFSVIFTKAPLQTA
jgi:hypothetical protein